MVTDSKIKINREFLFYNTRSFSWLDTFPNKYSGKTLKKLFFSVAWFLLSCRYSNVQKKNLHILLPIIVFAKSFFNSIAKLAFLKYGATAFSFRGLRLL